MSSTTAAWKPVSRASAATISDDHLEESERSTPEREAPDFEGLDLPIGALQFWMEVGIAAQCFAAIFPLDRQIGNKNKE
ncbi:hypothetical protein [Ensifer sp. Root31]|uniref:hypothetical protein n=1 Tax=Ensifer sp. Root31 TaxID=1736512 RepID=UPI000B2387FD|nr:hypothetical protein [Ensifer sp. Root31]